MANITEIVNFDSVVYLIASNDPVQGGTQSDIANLQAVALANRTQWLKAQIEAILTNQATDESNIAANTTAISGILTRLSTDETNISNNASAITALQSQVVPSGAIIAFGGTSAPTGFLLCNGAAISRTTYATLFAAIGVAWGGGDGINTFNVPDYRGYFMRFNDSMGGSGAGVDSGRNIGTSQGDAVQSHVHNVPAVGRIANFTNAGYVVPGTAMVANPQIDNISTNSQSGNTAGETRPVNKSAYAIIKY